MAADVAALTGRRLLLVRHGQTAWNAEGRAQGHADVPLDETGHVQARSMATAVAAYAPVLLVCSDLARARQSAEYVEAATGLVVEEDPRWREYDLGSRTGLTGEEAEANVLIDDGESDEEVAARVVPAVHDTLDRLRTGETAVVVTHGGALRLALAGALGWPLSAAGGLGVLHNCAWATLEEAPGDRLRLTAYDHPPGFASVVPIG